MTWHIDATVAKAYADGGLDDIRAASLEAHLVMCEGCRRSVASHADQQFRGRLDATWSNVVDALDAPRLGVVERGLHRLGVPDHIARLLAATPALHASWLAAVMAVIAFAVLAAYAAPRGFLTFLAIAPLIPLAGIATAYGPGVDPTYEIGMASPLYSFRLLLLRAAAVLLTGIGLTAVGALALPSVGWAAVAWLLPALTLSLASLALNGVLNPLWAAAGLGFGWVASVAAVAAGRSSASLVLGNDAQATWAVLAVIAAVIVFLRRDRYDTAAAHDN